MYVWGCTSIDVNNNKIQGCNLIDFNGVILPTYNFISYQKWLYIGKKNWRKYLEKLNQLLINCQKEGVNTYVYIHAYMYVNLNFEIEKTKCFQ